MGGFDMCSILFVEDICVSARAHKRKDESILLSSIHENPVTLNMALFAPRIFSFEGVVAELRWQGLASRQGVDNNIELPKVVTT